MLLESEQERLDPTVPVVAVATEILRNYHNDTH